MFTVSVGNLPPGASVLIKITYVAELQVEGENIVFTLPGSVAPWKQEAALDEVTQVLYMFVQLTITCVCRLMLKKLKFVQMLKIFQYKLLLICLLLSDLLNHLHIRLG